VRRNTTHVAVLDEVAHVGRDDLPGAAAAAHELSRPADELALELGEAHLWWWSLEGEVAHEEGGAGLGRDRVERGGGELCRGVVEEGEELLDGRRIGARDELGEGLDGGDRCW